MRTGKEWNQYRILLRFVSLFLSVCVRISWKAWQVTCSSRSFLNLEEEEERGWKFSTSLVVFEFGGLIWHSLAGWCHFTKLLCWFALLHWEGEIERRVLCWVVFLFIFFLSLFGAFMSSSDLFLLFAGQSLFFFFCSVFTLLSNCYCLSHAKVTITPEVASRTVNRAIMAELVRLYRESELGMRLPAYDGRKSLYTAGELPFAAKEFTVKLLDDDDGNICPK